MLPDPRRYGSGVAGHPIGRLADHRHELVGALRELAAAHRDAELHTALESASGASEYARVWSALCQAIEAAGDEAGPVPRLFAIPWVIVCAASAAATIDCVLPDVSALTRVLEKHGAFGASRNLGLGHALCGIESLEGLSPSDVLEGWQNPRLRELPPLPIEVPRGAEEVHVRFLLGAAVVPAHAPGIAETGANIGAWGTPALRSLLEQLATPNIQMLPMPRPPAGLYTAAYAGRRAGLETAFTLFVSNAVRRFRRSVGEPHVTLSSHAGGEVRMTLWTPVDDEMIEGFRWPLHPADNLEDVEQTMSSMIHACRLGDPDVRSEVLADCTSSGAVLFPAG